MYQLQSVSRPRIDQLTQPPQVGQYYSVPCLLPVDRAAPMDLNPDSPTIQWLCSAQPVLLPVQTNPERRLYHFHVDYRFCSDWQMQKLHLNEQNSAMRGSILLRAMTTPHGKNIRNLFDICWLKRRCYRSMPVFAPPALLPSDNLLKAFTDSPLRCDCCPHQDEPVITLPQLNSSQVVCRRQGLTINIQHHRVTESQTSTCCQQLHDLLNWQIYILYSTHWSKCPASNLADLLLEEVQDFSILA